MATTSQKMMEMRFFVRIRGAFTPPPMMDEPVMKIPLGVSVGRYFSMGEKMARTMQLRRLRGRYIGLFLLKPIHMAIWLELHLRPGNELLEKSGGKMDMLDTLKASPSPVNSISKLVSTHHGALRSFVHRPITVKAAVAPPAAYWRPIPLVATD